MSRSTLVSSHMHAGASANALTTAPLPAQCCVHAGKWLHACMYGLRQDAQLCRWPMGNNHVAASHMAYTSLMLPCWVNTTWCMKSRGCTGVYSEGRAFDLSQTWLCNTACTLVNSYTTVGSVAKPSGSVLALCGQWQSHLGEKPFLCLLWPVIHLHPTQHCLPLNHAGMCALGTEAPRYPIDTHTRPSVELL